MKYAQMIRDFISTLFGSKLVLQLRAELAEARREREYFRGQFERMQLIAMPRSAPAVPREVRPQGATQQGTRKSWAQIQAENTRQQNELVAKLEAANKEKTQ